MLGTHSPDSFSGQAVGIDPWNAPSDKLCGHILQTKLQGHMFGTRSPDKLSGRTLHTQPFEPISCQVLPINLGAQNLETHSPANTFGTDSSDKSQTYSLGRLTGRILRTNSPKIRWELLLGHTGAHSPQWRAALSMTFFACTCSVPFTVRMEIILAPSLEFQAGSRPFS